MNDVGVTPSQDASPFYTRDGMRHIPPYPHTYATSAKGRWIGMPLIEAFGREFAVVSEDGGDEAPTASSSTAQPTQPQLPSVSLDWGRNSLTYAQKMADGLLFVLKREAECQSAGKALVQAINELLCDPCLGLDKDQFFAKLPKLVVLRQLDAIRHVVTRREHPIDFSQQCIEIVATVRNRSAEERRISHDDALPDAPTQSTFSVINSPPYFIAVNKPSSLSIHPGGRFHNNTLLRILEDVFCGCPTTKGPDNDNERHDGRRPFLLVVEGRLIAQPATAMPSTFICERVAAHESPSDNAQVCKAWHPTIRLPHDRLSDGDRQWLLGFLSSRRVSINTMGSQVSIIGLAPSSIVVCPLSSPNFTESARSPKATSPQQAGLKLHIVHRLDRCTSGIIAFALDAGSARIITESFADKDDACASVKEGDDTTISTSAASVPALRKHKRYLARVIGDMRPVFAESMALSTEANTRASDQAVVMINSATYCTSYQQATYWCLDASEQSKWEAYVKDATAMTNNGFEEESQKLGGKRARQNGYKNVEEKREAMRALVASKRKVEVSSTSTKATSNEGSTEPFQSYEGLKGARTSVQLKFYDAVANETVVECTPHTGRTHQIRIHLASKGFPIVGDTKYMAEGIAIKNQGAISRIEQPSAPTEDAPAICLHALEYTIPPNHVVRTDPPHWAQQSTSK